MYSSKKFIHHQYYISADWTGGIFVSPTLAGSRSDCKLFSFFSSILLNFPPYFFSLTLAGSRSGGIVAATWAALVNHGMEGYIEATKNLLAASKKVLYQVYISVTHRMQKQRSVHMSIVVTLKAQRN